MLWILSLVALAKFVIAGLVTVLALSIRTCSSASGSRPGPFGLLASQRLGLFFMSSWSLQSPALVVAGVLVVIVVVPSTTFGCADCDLLE